MVCKKCGKVCSCTVKKKRKATVRRPGPARVLKGTTSTMLNPPGVDIVSLVRLVSDLNAKTMPKVTTSPTMVSTGVGTSPTMVSTGVGTSPTMDLSPLIKRIASVKSTPKVSTGTSTTSMDLSPLIKRIASAKSVPKVSTGVGTEMPQMASTGVGTVTPSMVSTGVGTLSPTMVSTGTGTTSMNLLPLISRIASAKSVPKVDASVGTTQRATPYKSGFMSILPEVQRAAAISERAIASKTFTETKGTGTRTLTVPQVEALLEQGQIIRPPGGRLPAGERQARELAQAAQAAATEAEGNRPPM